MKYLNLFIGLFIASSVFGQFDHNINKSTGTETNPVNEIDSIHFNGTLNEMNVVLDNGDVETHDLFEIIDVTFSLDTPGEIDGLNCGGTNLVGDLVDGVPASNVTAQVPYTGGNGGTFFGETVSSTGVTGLTAELSPGNFSMGGGSVNYQISGTPSSTGTASFDIEVVGESCTMELTVVSGEVGNLDCSNATLVGDLVDGQNTSGTTVEIDYTGGNGGPHNGQTVNSTGITGLTAELSGGNFDIGNGTLSYEITGTPNGDGTAVFAIDIGGETCNLEVPVSTGEVASLDCAGATAIGDAIFVEGLAISNTGLQIDYSGGNGGPHPNLVFNSTGVTGIVAELPAGNYSPAGGTLFFSVSGTPNSSGTATLELDIGGQICNFEITVESGLVSSLDCASATINGNAVDGFPVSNPFTVEIDYTGGNEGPYAAQTINSTGVTGLEANIAGGTFADGAGTLTFDITGTPISDGTASFDLNIGGENCTLTITVDEYLFPAGTQNCGGTATFVVDVVSPQTGETWMDRNLGADQVAASSSDQDAFGDLYQWGRFSDGHQCRTSSTNANLSSTEQPSHGDFITAPAAPNDWLANPNDNLWDGTAGLNNPCPSGYRLPTETEIDNERSGVINSAGNAFNSFLKLPAAGYRFETTGGINSNVVGRYWTSTTLGDNARFLNFDSSSSTIALNSRALGHSVRCIKD